CSHDALKHRTAPRGSPPSASAFADSTWAGKDFAAARSSVAGSSPPHEASDSAAERTRVERDWRIGDLLGERAPSAAPSSLPVRAGVEGRRGRSRSDPSRPAGQDPPPLQVAEALQL